MQDPDRDRRRELALRLKARLEADGFDCYCPTKGKVKGDDPVSIEFTYLELAELVGALWDAVNIPYVREEVRYLQGTWDQLDEALLACGENVTPVLHRFELRKEGKNRRSMRRKLEMARDYCLLIRSNYVESPERLKWTIGLSEQGPDRLFGETNRRNFEIGASPWKNLPDDPPPPKVPGETTGGRVLSPVEAVHVIARWYGCDTVLQAREQLLDARKALKANLDHPIVCKQFPPPYDHFEIPDPAKLGEFRHIDAMGRSRG